MKISFFKTSIILLLLTSTISIAQPIDATKNKKTFKENLRYGGGLGLSFGNDFFSGTIAPNVLYEVNDYLLTGVGLNLTYSSFANSDAFIYGGSLIGISNPIPDLQFSVEFEQLRVNRTFDTALGSVEDNYWYPALFLGAGYMSGRVTFGVRYDILYDDNKSIYANAFMPFVRVLF